MSRTWYRILTDGDQYKVQWYAGWFGGWHDITDCDIDFPSTFYFKTYSEADGYIQKLIDDEKAIKAKKWVVAYPDDQWYRDNDLMRSQGTSRHKEIELHNSYYDNNFPD